MPQQSRADHLIKLIPYDGSWLQWIAHTGSQQSKAEAISDAPVCLRADRQDLSLCIQEACCQSACMAMCFPVKLRSFLCHCACHFEQAVMGPHTAPHISGFHWAPSGSLLRQPTRQGYSLLQEPHNTWGSAAPLLRQQAPQHGQ